MIVSTALAIIQFVIVLLIVRDVRRGRRAKQALEGQLRFSLTEDGVSGTDPEGGTFSDAWSCYTGFHMASRVIVMPKQNPYVYLRIPIETLSESERQEVCLALSNHLPALSSAALCPLGAVSAPR